MAKVQMDLQSALDMALEALDEYSESHPAQAKEAVEHMATLGTILRMFPDQQEFRLWKQQRDNKLEELREKERQRQATLGL